MLKIQGVLLALGISTFLVTQTECRPTNNPGTVTRTAVTHFTFFGRIANPCEIRPAQPVSSTAATTASQTEVTTANSRLDFYQSMLTAVSVAMSKLQLLESADPSLPDCNGISLDSLPGTPPLDNMNEGETMKQSYQTGIFLSAHLHLMALDRQTTILGDNNISDDQLEESVPLWRFLRCGNESESFPSNLEEVTIQMENIVCMILTSATDEQRASFRAPFNRLSKTVLYRYHSSCSTLQTRDCLVVREAKQALSLIQRKFSMLITNASQNSGFSNNGVTGADDDMDNSL